MLQHVSDHKRIHHQRALYSAWLKIPRMILSLIVDDLWSEICCSTFKYFIILIVSTYYILCISWIVKCLIIIDARCKHKDS